MIRKSLDSSYTIYLRTLEQERYALSEEDKTNAYLKHEKEGIVWFASSYFAFGLMAFVYAGFDFVKLLALCYRHRIKVIHLWCTPPAVVAYLLSMFTGATIVLDSYEPHAEAMVENGEWMRSSFKFKLLFWFEKLISKKAKIVISATQGMKTYALHKYGVLLDVFYVKPACVDTEKFSFHFKKNPELLKRFSLERKVVGLYAGKFGGIYLEQEVFDLIKVFSNYYGDRFRMLILTIHSREELEQWCFQSGIDPSIVISAFVSHKDIPDYMGLADFAITPVKSVPSKRYCTPIKDGEYWSLGLPVVITPNISDDSEIIANNKIGVVLNGLNKEAYQEAVEGIDSLLKQHTAKELYDKIHYIAVSYRSMSIAESIYKNIYY